MGGGRTRTMARAHHSPPTRPFPTRKSPPQALASPALPGAALSHGSRPHSDMTTITVPLKEGDMSVVVADDSDVAEQARSEALVKMGMMTALAIGIHNFPEVAPIHCTARTRRDARVLIR